MKGSKSFLTFAIIETYMFIDDLGELENNEMATKTSK